MRDKMEYLGAGGWKLKDAMLWVEKNVQPKITSKKSPETNPRYHKIYVSDDHVGHRIVTTEIPEIIGINAVFCKDCNVVCAYLFMKDKVYSLDYLNNLLKFKQRNLKTTNSPIIAENYKHTIKCLEREIKKRQEI